MRLRCGRYLRNGSTNLGRISHASKSLQGPCKGGGVNSILKCNTLPDFDQSSFPARSLSVMAQTQESDQTFSAVSTMSMMV